MNIIQWLLESGHAKAERHAENIIALLELWKLYEVQDYDGIKARVELYEAWKTSGMYDKKDRAACADRAIAGEPVPELPIIAYSSEYFQAIDESDREPNESDDDYLYQAIHQIGGGFTE